MLDASGEHGKAVVEKGKFSTEETRREEEGEVMHTRGSHTFLEEQKFFKNAKFVRERWSQWAGVVHEEGVTPIFDM